MELFVCIGDSSIFREEQDLLSDVFLSDHSIRRNPWLYIPNASQLDVVMCSYALCTVFVPREDHCSGFIWIQHMHYFFLYSRHHKFSRAPISGMAHHFGWVAVTFSRGKAFKNMKHQSCLALYDE